MRRAIGIAAVTLAGASAFGSCSCPPATVRHGTVIGTLMRVGGPAPGAAVPLPGQVVATSSAGRRFEVTVGKSGRYRLILPAGTYRLIGRSPLVRVGGAEMRCGPTVVQVRDGQASAGAYVFCLVR